MLCACSGERFKIEEAPQSPESLATRDFSASGLSSRTAGDWESKYEDIQVDEAESTLKEALSLNYEEARALLGRLEFQRGNFDAALQVFEGIDVKALTQKMTMAIVERARPRKPRSKPDSIPIGLMSMHSVSLLAEAILLKARSLEHLGRYIDAAKECKTIVDTVESALPNGTASGIGGGCKLQEMFHRALELLPELWTKAGSVENAIAAYRRALVKPWNLDPERLAFAQKSLAKTLLYSGVETNLPLQYQVWGQPTPRNGPEEAVLLLLILMRKVSAREIVWDPEIMDHLTYALSVSGQFDLLARHVEQLLPGTYPRADRWYFLALCYAAAAQDEAAVNLLKKVLGRSESASGARGPGLRSSLLGAELCSRDPARAREGIEFSRVAVEMAAGGHFSGRARRLLGVCYGNAARASVSDSERNVLRRESLERLSEAAAADDADDDPEAMFWVGAENAEQRNLDAAFESAAAYADSPAGATRRGWKLLALVASAKQRLEDAETVVDFALDEAAKSDQFELLRLKAVLQVARERPKQAIETYRVLLALLRAKKEDRSRRFQLPNGLDSEVVLEEKKLESETWQDLASIYTKIGLWSDAKICVDKAKSIEFYSPSGWHTTGALFEAQRMYKEALISFSLSLSIQPDYVPSIVSTAKVLMGFGDQSLPIARSFLMNALRIEPTNHEAWLSLGLVSKSEGLLQQAAEFFQAAHELKMTAPVQSFAS